MKKLLAFTFAILAVLAFAAAPGFACGEKNSTASTSKVDGKLVSSSSGTDGKLANSGKACSFKKTDGKLASSSSYANSAGCSAKKTASLASYKMSENSRLVQSSHNAHCNVGEGCQLVNISVDGMTCGGCESGVKSALVKVDGVNGVVNIDYKEGIAQVCTKHGIENAELTKAVSTTGFESKIIPAVVKTSYKDSKASKTTLTSYDKHNCSEVCKANMKNAKASSDKVEAKAVKSTGDTY